MSEEKERQCCSAATAQPPAAPVETQGMREALLELSQCDGSSENVANADILARRVRRIAMNALAAQPPAADSAPAQGSRDAIDRIIVSAMAWQPSENGPSYDQKRAELMARLDATPTAAVDISTLTPNATTIAALQEPFMMLSCREAKRCLHNIPGCICDGDPTNG